MILTGGVASYTYIYIWSKVQALQARLIVLQFKVWIRLYIYIHIYIYTQYITHICIYTGIPQEINRNLGVCVYIYMYICT